MSETPAESPQEPAGGDPGVNEEQHVPAAPAPAEAPVDGDEDGDRGEDEDAAE